ncbi:RHS repeat-associated core domain-containing protein [Streptomyces desertarenae]|uniref:RHS repeat-associated core domain-containing protein n=1 Tax=Streptomyces desertarenae TaxID=2666184 RepID=A0ABW4PN94_9ACTN
MRTGGKSHYCLTDALGSVMGLVDADGQRTHTYDYGPTGLPRTTPTETVPQPYRFTGTYLDPTGLYKMGARYYDPHLGRFTQPDPSGQETNPCLYASGDPVNCTDPQGTSAPGCVGGALSVVGGALSFGAGVAPVFGSGGLSTPASLGATGAGLDSPVPDSE